MIETLTRAQRRLFDGAKERIENAQQGVKTVTMHFEMFKLVRKAAIVDNITGLEATVLLGVGASNATEWSKLANLSNALAKAGLLAE